MSTLSVPVRLLKEGPVARLRLERPEKRNALSLAMWDAIPGLLAEAAEIEGLKALILEGAGGVFSAGADIAEFETVYATRAAALENQARMQKAMAALEDFPAPTIAAIAGACVGGGCGLALCTDLRFADETARFGVTPGKLGLVYGVSDTRRLVAAVGPAAAKRILFTGAIFEARVAHGLGLVDEVAPAGQLEPVVAALCGEIAAASAATARATKKILRKLREGAADDDNASRTLFADAFEGADFREGFRAFLEKRPPRFS